MNDTNRRVSELAMQIVNGFLFGTGLVLASALGRLVIHNGICG